MKPRACIVVSSDMTVRAFLVPQLRAMQEQYELTVMANTRHRELLWSLGVTGALERVAIERQIHPARDLVALAQLVRLMRRGRFDLVHSFTPKAGLLGMCAAAIARVPIRVHTFTGQVWATRRGLARRMLKAMDRMIAGCASYTLADSPSQRDFLVREHVVRGSKISVLGSGSVSGVDPERFRPADGARQAFRQRLGIPDSDVVLLFAGRLHRDKGVLDLARAFAALAAEQENVHLLCVGSDEHNLRTTIAAHCEPHSRRVHFEDFMEAPEHAMAAADVLCLPSYREGFGSVIIEAAAARVPAVASRIYGIIDAVVEERTGLLHKPGDVGELLAQLRRLASAPELRATLGRNARERVCREFAQNTITTALLNLYARLLSAPRDRYRLVWKRVLDVVVAFVAGAALLPIAVLIGIMVRVFLGSPVIFRQRRPGLNGAPFEMIKFRSMLDGYDGHGRRLPDSARLTPFGRFLRATSLDELPELWNVLKGDMSLVGPRPLLIEYLPRYTPAQARRHEVRPGITGLAQVHGRNDLPWAQRFELDVKYVDGCSIALDIQIVAATIVQVISRRGISQSGQATAEEFMGTPGEVVR
jgi:lipopolysaccharide/colanic/teichoic acid biosynthesis glycosyltransferase